jgi:hypothetical protein
MLLAVAAQTAAADSDSDLALTRALAQLAAYDDAVRSMTPAERKLDPTLRLPATADRLAHLLPSHAVQRARAHLGLPVGKRALALAPTMAHRLPLQIHVRQGHAGLLPDILAALAPTATVRACGGDSTRGLCVDATLADAVAVAAHPSVTHVVHDAPPRPHPTPPSRSARTPNDGDGRQRRTAAGGDGAGWDPALVAHGLDTLRAQRPELTGGGVLLCLVADTLSAADLAAAQASGTAPAHVTMVTPPGAGSSPSGADIYWSLPAVAGTALAALEVMFAVAPNATFAFAPGLGGQAVQAQAISALADAGCHVICDTLLYVGEPTYSDGPVAAAVDRAVAAGAVYVVAAGDDYHATDDGLAAAAAAPPPSGGVWEGTALFAPAGGYLALSFGTDPITNATVAINALTRDPPLAITLRWAASPSAPATNYDLLLLSPTGDLLFLSDRNLNSPLEWIDSPPPFDDVGNTVLVVARTATGPWPVACVHTHGGGFSLATPGSASGHVAAPGAFAVGAVAPPSEPPSRSFATALAAGQVPVVRAVSPDGPRTLFYSQFGVPNRADPTELGSSGTVVRAVPTVLAADGLHTHPLASFDGTAAAAASTAAQLALLRQLAPTLSPAAVYALVTANALGGSGNAGAAWGPLRGYGVLDLPTIIANMTRMRLCLGRAAHTCMCSQECGPSEQGVSRAPTMM